MIVFMRTLTMNVMLVLLIVGAVTEDAAWMYAALIMAAFMGGAYLTAAIMIILFRRHR